MTARELEELLQNIEPDIEVPKDLQGVKPDALKTPLYKHQEVALTWMKKMEDGTNKGGILADDMGLGKTISTLALIHERKSSSRPKVRSPMDGQQHDANDYQTNLIIAPVALMRQWEEEIKMKTESRYKLSVFVYHGKKASVDHLLGYDVVLTTYGTVAAQLKRLEKWHEDRKDRALDYNDRDLAVKCPLLHPQKSRFHRVILDEAQCIKNKDTQTAKACHQIDAKFRWCLTGTPMMNGVSELYSLLKFLRIRPYNSWVEFRQVCAQSRYLIKC
jgi:SNF2 family DNA or RNA helicase